MHLERIEHVEKYGARKLYLNSLQSLLMALHPSENPQQKPLYLEKYRVLIRVKRKCLKFVLMSFTFETIFEAILTSERKNSELQTLLYKGLRDLGTDFPSEC